jgi:hypothetical protein
MFGLCFERAGNTITGFALLAESMFMMLPISPLVFHFFSMAVHTADQFVLFKGGEISIDGGEIGHWEPVDKLRGGPGPFFLKEMKNGHAIF